MNQNTFHDFHTDFINEADKVLFSKMADYANVDDQLANFRGAAKRLGLTPLQVWAVYFEKHVNSVLTLAQEGKLASEPARQRFIDLANYAVLGAAIEESIPAPVTAKPDQAFH